MEPLHPELRRALKEANPELSDADIDRLESLQSRRFQLDPELEAQEIERIRAEVAELLRAKAPKYREVVSAFARRRRRPAPAAPKVRIRRRR